MSTFEIVAIMAVTVVFGGGYMWLLSWVHGQMVEVWKQLAEKLELELDLANWHMWGTYRGIDVDLDRQSSGSAKNNNMLTVMRGRLDPAQMPADLELQREWSPTRVHAEMIPEEERLGLPGLEQVLIESGDRAEILAWASDPDVNRALKYLLDGTWVFEVHSEFVEIRFNWQVRDVERYQFMLDAVVRVAHAFLGNGFSEGEW